MLIEQDDSSAEYQLLGPDHEAFDLVHEVSPSLSIMSVIIEIATHHALPR